MSRKKGGGGGRGAKAPAPAPTPATTPSPDASPINSGSRPRPRPHAPVLAAILLALFAGQVIHGMLRMSATYDEQVYVTAGVEYFRAGDFTMKRDAPPLIATLARASLCLFEVFKGPLLHSSLGAASGPRDEYEVARRLFWRENDGGFLILQCARVPIALLGLVLGAHVFLFGRALFGEVAGLFALLICCFDPNIVGHARVVSADLGLAAFFCAAHYWHWRAISSRDAAPLAWFALFAALTLCVKFTGILLIPSLALLTALHAAFPPDSLMASTGLDRAGYRTFILRRAALGAAGAAVAFLLLVSFLYHGADGLFRYIEGARLIYANILPGYKYYLIGRFAERPSPFYYLVAVAVKTPAATLLLALAGLALAARAPKVDRARLLALLLPFALVHAVSAMDRTSLGLRRALLGYPFLFVLIGSLAPRVEAWMKSRARSAHAFALAAAALVACAVAEPLARHPYQLSFFNLLPAGGPLNGWRWLDDSNVDWGQNLPPLRDWMRRRGVERVALQYFGADVPSAYGIVSRPVGDDEWARPRPEVYVASVHMLLRNRLLMRGRQDRAMDWLATRKPDAVLGYALYVYDLRPAAARAIGPGGSHP